VSEAATLAIDQGTSGTKAVVLAADGRVLASAYRSVHPRYGGGGTVEVDPLAVWNSVVESGREAIAAAGVRVDRAGLANQGETVLVWDPVSGAPLSPTLVWQDHRARTVCERLAPAAPRLCELTGLPLSEYFAAPKMTWLREQGYHGGVVTMIDAWIMHRLTGRFLTDAATASRSLLTNLSSGQWAPEALEIFGLGSEPLPEIADCAADFGASTAFGPEVAITGAAVDQQAALFGQGCLEAGSAKCTYGTGAFLLLNAGTSPPRSARGLPSSIAWSLAGQRTYCLDGQVFAAGSATRWLAGLGVISDLIDLDPVAGTVTDCGGVTFVPALAGLAAPWWAESARGQITGLGLDTEPGHLVRALVEGIAAQVTHLVRVAEADLGTPLAELRVDGGLTRSRTLMQAQADLLQRPVRVFHSPDATALGAGALARLRRDCANPRPTDSPAPVIYEPQVPSDAAAERMARFTAVVESMIARTPAPEETS
jgi:glycerol kinase